MHVTIKYRGKTYSGEIIAWSIWGQADDFGPCAIIKTDDGEFIPASPIDIQAHD